MIVAQSVSTKEVISKLCAIDPKSTSYVNKRISTLKLNKDHFTSQMRFKYPDALLVEAVKASDNMSKVITYLGASKESSMHRHLTRRVSKLKLDTSHFVRVLSNDVLTKRAQATLSLGKEGDYRKDARVLRNAMLREGIENCCNECKVSAWNGRPLVLDVDHINGDNWDNRIENLQFLCPNCHRQTDTWGRAGKVKKGRILPTLLPTGELAVPALLNRTCSECTKPIGPDGNGLCVNCAHIAQQKISWPSIESLLFDLRTMSRVALGKKLGVSDTAIKKHLKYRGVTSYVTFRNKKEKVCYIK